MSTEGGALHSKDSHRPQVGNLLDCAAWKELRKILAGPARQLTLDLGDLGGDVLQAVGAVLVGGAQVAQRRKAGACTTIVQLDIFTQTSPDAVRPGAACREQHTVQRKADGQSPGRKGCAAALPRHASSVSVAAVLMVAVMSAATSQATCGSRR
jgi:hypothetical protein